MKMTLQQLIFDALAAAHLSSSAIAQPSDIHVEHPQIAEHGDYSTNVAMQLARELKKNPLEIAQALAAAIAPHADIARVEAARPGFVNFTLAPAWFATQVTRLLVDPKSTVHNVGGGKIVLLEFSSPNIAKPMHVGHLRNTVIGDALRRIYTSLGYHVISINHLGDWGTQFGILLYAYKRFGDKEKIARDPINELYRLYVDFNKLMAENPSLKSHGKEEFVKLEQGDKENRELWEHFREISLGEFQKAYDQLGIPAFDHSIGESFYMDKMQREISQLLEQKIATQGEDGSVYVDLEPYGLGRFIAVKSDGATTYGTRDIATFRYRAEQFDFVKSLYVVGLEQFHHLQQVFKVAELMGLPKVALAHHVTYGLVKDASGLKMSTRKGTLITAQDMIDRAVEKARELIREKNPDLANADEVAREVGIGALKYANLSQSRNTPILFNWEKVLAFDGNTGPYLQYTHARIQGVLRKVDALPDAATADLSVLSAASEIALLKHLYKISETVEAAALDYAPNHIAEYLFKLASLFNEFYAAEPVLKAEQPAVRDARVVLLQAVATALAQGLSLLGIHAPERM